MQLENIPTEVISRFNTLGEIIPIKLRIENEEHQLLTAQITSILFTQENKFCGVRTVDFCCKTLIEDKEHLIELRYFLDTHKWAIRRVLH